MSTAIRSRRLSNSFAVGSGPNADEPESPQRPKGSDPSQQIFDTEVRDRSRNVDELKCYEPVPAEVAIRARNIGKTQAPQCGDQREGTENGRQHDPLLQTIAGPHFAANPERFDRSIDVVARRSCRVDGFSLIVGNVGEMGAQIGKPPSEPAKNLLLCDTEPAKCEQIATQNDELFQRGQALLLVLGIELVIQILGKFGRTEDAGQMSIDHRIQHGMSERGARVLRQIGRLAERRGKVLIHDRQFPVPDGYEVAIAYHKGNRCRANLRRRVLLDAHGVRCDECPTWQRVEFRHAHGNEAIFNGQRCQEEVLLEPAEELRVRLHEIDPDKAAGGDRLRELVKSYVTYNGMAV